MTDEIRDLNADRIPQYATVAAGTTLKLPNEKTYKAPAATTLGKLAGQVLHDPGQAQALLDLNADRLNPPQQLPAGAELRLPQRSAPAMILFIGLAVLLIWIGSRWRLEKKDLA